MSPQEKEAIERAQNELPEKHMKNYRPEVILVGVFSFSASHILLFCVRPELPILPPHGFNLQF